MDNIVPIDFAARFAPVLAAQRGGPALEGAVHVRTIEDVLDHLRRGWSVRMSDGINRPSLVSARSLEVKIEGDKA